MDTRNINAYSLLQKISNRITLDNIDKIDENLVDTLIKEKQGSYKDIDINTNYIAFIFIEYKKLFYPFFFFKFKHKKENIKLINQPIFCKLTLNLLTSLGINSQDIHKSSDLSTVILTLQGLIEKNHLKMKIVKNIHFYSDEDLIIQDSYSLINEITSQPNNKLSGLFRESNITSDIDFFNFQKKCLDNYLENKVSKVVIENSNLKDLFVINFINSLVIKNNILVLCSNEEEKRKTLSFLRNYFGSYIVSDLSKIDEQKLDYNHKENYSLKELKVKKDFQEFEENSKFFFELYEKNENIYKKYHLKDLTINFDSSDVENVLFDINTSTYRYIDLQKDELFLQNIKNNTSILKSYITNHPFYGISGNTDINKYNEIITLIKDIKAQEIDINNYINDNKIKTLENKEIQTFKDLESLLADVQMLNNFPNMPLNMFDNEIVDDLNNIVNLKNVYHNLSASKLVIQTLTKRDFLSSNLEETIKLYNSKNIFNHFKGLKIIYDNLIVKKLSKVKPLAKVISKYVSFEDEISKVLPQYEKVFGAKVKTLSGLKEIENEYEYVINFNDKKEKAPYFSIENEFIKNYFTNKTFKTNISKKIEILESKYKILKENLNKYLSIFIDDKTEYLNIPIQDNINLFDIKSQSSEKEFIEYIKYLKISKNTSQLLQLTLRKCMIDKTPINVLLDNFVNSVSKLNYREARREINIFKNDYTKVKAEYLSKLVKMSNLFVLDYKEKLILPNNSQMNIKNTKLLPYFDEVSSSKLIEKLQHKKIVVCQSNDLIGIDDEIFDNIIISDSAIYPIETILNCLRLSKKIMFIDKKENIDSLTQGYLYTNLSTDKLIKNVFNFDLFESSIFNKLKKDLNKKGLKLVQEDFIYIIDEKKKKKYILLPSSTFVEPIVSNQLLKAFEYIASIKKHPILLLDVIKYQFNPENGIKEMLKPFIF